MKVYAGLVVLAKDGPSVKVLVDSQGYFPTWTVTEKSPESLDLVKQGFYNITGMSNWPVYFKQAGFFEFSGLEKRLLIVYNVYLQSKCELSCTGYSWTDIREISCDSEMEKIIRYIASKRE